MTKSNVFALSLGLAFFLLPLSLALLYPISFWLGNDYEPLGLANGLNLAFRLGHGQMYPAEGMTNHPGVPFYLMSWSALALTGYPLATNALDFFYSALDHIRAYQLNSIALASLVGASSIYLFVRVASPIATAPIIITALALWVLSTPATLTNFLSPSNESFALLINVLFLLSLLQISRDHRGTVRSFSIAAAVSSMAYLNKLSYCYVPAALCAAMFAQYAFPLKRALRLATGLLIFSSVFVAIVAAVGYFIIGWVSFRGVLAFHRSVILGAGLYGGGSPTLVSTEEILNALQSIWPDKSFAIPIALIGGTVLLFSASAFLLKQHRPRPDITVAIGCGTAAALSAMFVLKHYGYHYSAGVSATLPGCVIACHSLTRARSFWTAPLIAAVILLMIAYPVTSRLQYYLITRAESSRATLLDHEEILRLASIQNKVVDYAYRAPFREYGEGFVVNYASVEPLTNAYVKDRRGTTNSITEHLVREDVGVYVIDKGYFPTADAVKEAANVDLLGPRPVRYHDGDTLIELRTVFVLMPRADR